MQSTTCGMNPISLRDVQTELSVGVSPERKHRESYGIATDLNIEAISEVSEQPPRSSNVASIGPHSIKIPESLYVTVIVAKELVICLMVTPCLNKESWKLSCLTYGELTSWDLSHHHTQTLIFWWQLTMYQNGLRLLPHPPMILKQCWSSSRNISLAGLVSLEC